jgi:hypothetical protein
MDPVVQVPDVPVLQRAAHGGRRRPPGPRRLPRSASPPVTPLASPGAPLPGGPRLRRGRPAYRPVHPGRIRLAAAEGAGAQRQSPHEATVAEHWMQGVGTPPGSVQLTKYSHAGVPVPAVSAHRARIPAPGGAQEVEPSGTGMPLPWYGAQRGSSLPPHATRTNAANKRAVFTSTSKGYGRRTVAHSAQSSSNPPARPGRRAARRPPGCPGRSWSRPGVGVAAAEGAALRTASESVTRMQDVRRAPRVEWPVHIV